MSDNVLEYNWITIDIQSLEVIPAVRRKELGKVAW